MAKLEELKAKAALNQASAKKDLKIIQDGGKKILSILPEQYKTESDSAYLKIQSVVDFVSGMTDIFALDLYRKIKGISLPGVV